MTRTPPFSEADAGAAIAASISWSGALRLLGYEPKGCNYRTLQRWARVWVLRTNHVDPNGARRHAMARRLTPLEQILVESSPYPRWHPKRRLLTNGLKRPVCELCGQAGQQMSLVLDHINGISNDNRLDNLRIVCPNCAATFDTHCGRNLSRQRLCAACKRSFAPARIRHRYCSQTRNSVPPRRDGRIGDQTAPSVSSRR